MKTYRTKKRINKVAIRKTYALLFALIISAGVIGWHSVALQKEISLNIASARISERQVEVEEEDMIAQIWNMAEKAEMKKEDIIKMLTIINCESRFDPYAINYNASSKSWDTGIAQWNGKYHPEVSRECAFDWKCAIGKMIEQFKKDGNFKQWSCNNK